MRNHLIVTLLVTLNIFLVTASHRNHTTTSKVQEPLRAAIADAGEDDEDDGDRNDESTEATATSSYKNETSLRGEARSSFGIPTEPHPGTKILVAPQVQQTTAFDKILNLGGATLTASLIDRGPNSELPEWERKNYGLKGQGALIGGRYVITNEESIPMPYNNGKHSYINRHQLPNKLDLQNMPEHITNPGIYQSQLSQVGPTRLGNTGLRLYQFEHNYRPYHHPFTDGHKLETDISQFGHDCSIHGYGRKHPNPPAWPSVFGGSRSAAAGANQVLNADSFFKDSEREYVKSPLATNSLGNCNPSGVCKLKTTRGYNFCPHAGAGSPVLCGKEQKLTYMAKYVHDESAECGNVVEAYHIPRLVPQIQDQITKFETNNAKISPKPQYLPKPTISVG